jgi:hypothetical protein
MAEIKLVFVTKVPHRPAVATIGECAAPRATRVHGAPFTEVCANDRSRSSLPSTGAPPRPNEKCVRMSALQVWIAASAEMSGKSINSIVIGAGAAQRCQPK